MTVTVDANILFSALISANSRIAQMLVDPTRSFQRISYHYAVIELFKHQPKIIKYAKKPVDEVLTGDKKLTTHLRVMGFERVLTTDELYQMPYPDTFSA